MEHSILLQTTPADCHEYFNVYLSRVMKVLSSITKFFHHPCSSLMLSLSGILWSFRA